MEYSLHQIGYAYVGPNSLYNLTLVEIKDLCVASNRKIMEMEGVDEREWEYFMDWSEERGLI